MRQSQQRLSLACLSLACLSLVSSAACCRLFAVLSLLVCSVTVAQAADSLPSDEHAAQLVREHIGRVVSYVQNGDAESLTLEFIPDGIRSLSTAKSPVAGRTAIRRQIEGTLEQYRERRFEKLNGEILAARFISPDTILGWGTFEFSNADGDLLRKGKWGDVLQVVDGKAKFVMQSAYIEHTDSLAGDTLSSDYEMTADPNGGDYQMIQRSINRFTKAYNDGNIDALLKEFTPNGVRIVSGIAGVYEGRDAIRKTFETEWSGELEVGDGSVLIGKTLHIHRIDDELIAASGVWRLTSQDGTVLDGGNWGNLFQQNGSEVQLLLESAGSCQE